MSFSQSARFHITKETVTYSYLHALILHRDFWSASFSFFRKIHVRCTILKSTELETPGKDLKSLLPWSSGENFSRDNVFRFGKTIFMSIPSCPQSKRLEWVHGSWNILRVPQPKYFLGIVLENGEAIAIDLSQTKWKYPFGRSVARRDENQGWLIFRIPDLFKSQWMVLKRNSEFLRIRVSKFVKFLSSNCTLCKIKIEFYLTLEWKHESNIWKI